MPKNIGRELNEEWGIHALRAFYSNDGTWFHRLDEFPGALFDAAGYVLFDTEDDYLNCPHLRINEHTHCTKGISLIPSYTKVGNESAKASDLAKPPKTKRKPSVVNRIVRDSPLARRIKSLHNNNCQVCGTTLMLLGNESYAEAHHIKPLGADHEGPDVAENIICVCPNCHAKLDLCAIQLQRSTLKFVPQHHIDDEYIDYHNNQLYKGAVGPP